ncbi:hypothetical protein [Massilia varians]|uniref:hypothetical protein n=1 Tax=Massilia varians TaxID=457921 RepID=UPI0025555C22|nr:hypothetical protein [Massilia varians]MDK6079489.1 hypothetical protein [Massilia varians]
MNSNPSRHPPLLAHLNGWRRIGVVLVGIWLIVASTILWRAPERVTEIWPGLAEPVHGTRAVHAPELQEELEAAKAKKLGRALEPWEKVWYPTRAIPAILPAELPVLTRWFLLLSVPVLTWHIVELLVRLVLWIRAGFTGSPRRK